MMSIDMNIVGGRKSGEENIDRGDSMALTGATVWHRSTTPQKQTKNDMNKTTRKRVPLFSAVALTRALGSGGARVARTEQTEAPEPAQAPEQAQSAHEVAQSRPVPEQAQSRPEHVPEVLAQSKPDLAPEQAQTGSRQVPGALVQSNPDVTPEQAQSRSKQASGQAQSTHADAWSEAAHELTLSQWAHEIGALCFALTIGAWLYVARRKRGNKYVEDGAYFRRGAKNDVPEHWQMRPKKPPDKPMQSNESDVTGSTGCLMMMNAMYNRPACRKEDVLRYMDENKDELITIFQSMIGSYNLPRDKELNVPVTKIVQEFYEKQSLVQLYKNEYNLDECVYAGQYCEEDEEEDEYGEEEDEYGGEEGEYYESHVDGEIKWVNQERGFGYIVVYGEFDQAGEGGVPDGREAWFHVSDMKDRSEFEEFSDPPDWVRFDLEYQEDRGEYRARNVELNTWT